MTTADEALSREVERGMTREDLLRRAAALGIVVAGGAAFGPLTEAAFAATKITRGGTFRLPVSGAGAQDFIDGQHIVAKSDIARLMAGWDRLAYIDERFRIRNELASELRQETREPDPHPHQDRHRVPQRQDAHDRRRHLLDPAHRATGSSACSATRAFTSIDVNRMRKLDNRTVRLFLKRPDVTLIEAFAQYFQGIVPGRLRAEAASGSGPLHGIGTGPYQAPELHPRPAERPRPERELLARGPAVLRPGRHLELPRRLVEGERAAVRAGRRDDRRAVRAGAGGTAAQQPEDLRVADRRLDAALHARSTWRRSATSACGSAFRLLANRPQIVRQGLSGHGTVGNDIFSPLDPAYAGDEFPQRRYDPERARSLLRAAGQENLEVELVTSPADTGMVEGATIFAENAQGRRRHRQGPERRRQHDLRRPVPEVAVLGGLLGHAQLPAAGRVRNPARAAFNETHWDEHPAVRALPAPVQPGRRRPSTRGRRAEIIREMQRMEYDDGRLHHLGLQEPRRRALDEDRRLQGRSRNAEPQQVRERLPHDLLRLTR